MFKRLIVLSFIVAFLSSCSTVSTFRKNDDTLLKRIRLLEARVEFNSQLIKINSQRIDSVALQLEKIKERLAKERKEASLDDIPPASVIDSLASSESQNKEKKQAKKIKTEPKIAENLVPTPVEVSKLTIQKPQQELNYKSLYNQALKEYKEGNYLEAAKLFEEFTKEFKNTDLYDNSLYWLGWSYLHLNEKDKAVELFNRLIKEFPYASLKQGGKTDAAIFTLIRLFKDDKRKKGYYKKLLFERFPKSVYVKKIKARSKE
ncbi:tetratricopeptide repeat protein [Hippea alviniae]|uniref:tetratricopeptide repeat protein n=1 Tax=Hippea alviniae TaxID=1279027 RepID=UPI0003B36C3E|nr:tetratricopeptide repeat protein [Hippea alviniae]